MQTWIILSCCSYCFLMVVYVKKQLMSLFLQDVYCDVKTKKKKGKLEEMRRRFVCTAVYSHSIKGTNVFLEMKYSNILLGRIHEVALRHAKFYINRIWG